MTTDCVIIIPAHNRRTITLECVQRLAAQDVGQWAHVIVVDDGSTDFTAAAIRAAAPAVEILTGNGDLWWTGAIALGMQAAVARGARYILWLNDDCAPAPGALHRLRAGAERHHAMVGGTCVLPGTDQVVYGGLRRRGFGFDLVPLRPGHVEPCDALSGNLVCFPIELVQAIGLPDAARFPQAIGDLDYGLRAKAAGWNVLVDHDAIAEAAPNAWHNHASWLLSEIPVWEIWRSAWRKTSYGYFPAQWAFFGRHWGPRGSLHACWLLVKRGPIMLIRLLVPQPWLRRIWARRSTAWREEQRLRGAQRTPPATEKSS